MRDAVKMTRLDCMMMKPYWKYFFYYLLFPLVFVFTTRSFAGSMAGGMCMLSFFACFPFQTEESTGFAEIYGFLPVSARCRVCGRYLLALAFCGGALVCSMILQFAAFALLGTGIGGEEVLCGVLLGAALYLAVTAVDYPVYYRFGAVKGRIVSTVLLALAVAALVFVGGLVQNGAAVSGLSVPAVLGAFGGAAVLFAVSLPLSARICADKNR